MDNLEGAEYGQSHDQPQGPVWEREWDNAENDKWLWKWRDQGGSVYEVHQFIESEDDSDLKGRVTIT